MVSLIAFMSFILVTNVVSQENRTADFDVPRIFLQLASSFFSSDDDFLVPRQHSNFFPLTNAKAVNKKVGRYNYENINSEEHADKITGSLRTWRGFPELGADLVLPFIDLMLTAFSRLFSRMEDIDLSVLELEGIQALPR